MKFVTPLQDVFLNALKYFITFIDNHTQYMYLFLLHDIIEATDTFKIYKAKVDKQLGKQIKIVRSDRSGEYSGRYTWMGQYLGPFARFL